MQTLMIQTAPAYPVYIGNDLIGKTGELMKGLGNYKKVSIVTDDQVAPLYLEKVISSFDEDVSISSYVIPHGETSKCAEMLFKLYHFFAEQKLSRSDLILALGGGVVGDLTGFAASTFLRGVAYVQIPTTLLAQVDSSVGGKTAIDIPEGKNLVGSFYQPKAVICDVDTLSTLTDTIFCDGMAEVIKYACIYDAELFPKLHGLSRKDVKNPILTEVIRRCLEIKAAVVAEDEKDTGLRMILNFGHTLGHAIEKQYHFSGYTHGQGVAIGMVKIIRLAEAAGLTEKGTADKIEALCKEHGLPTDCEISNDDLFRHCSMDKKNLNQSIYLILLEKIGQYKIHKLSPEGFRAFLESK